MQENERFYIKNGSNIDLKEKKSIENKYIDTLQKEKQAAFDMNETLKLTNKDKDEIISEMRNTINQKDEIINKLQSICGSGVGTANGNKKLR